LSRRTMIVLAVLALLGLAHAPILRLLARPLLAQGTTQQADYYCLRGDELGVDGFEPFEHAAAWHEEAPGRKILLLLPPDSRVVELGAAPSFEQMCRRELDKLRIPSNDLETIRAAAHDVWGEAHAMQAWLQEHPGAGVILACSPPSSGRLRYVLDKVIAPADAARVRLAWLPEPGKGLDNWWRSREGVKAFMYGWLELIYAWAEGDDARPAPAGAAAFQAEVRAKIGEAP
jgi:hypothetical protein